ncbi:hypothetical protein HYPSUDRAFT_73045 [Hypholoma sublateritium FD-334 SS-4]|uniref:Uncharacterized protein n=1 Tax=Hypholoma sublateritium (strain FD-334 SS-4) TaxID=945553 RepID=A0A0D2KFY9_HYPSF|nr:hypothetical protein HYPSUDRAFT_73045 [Hypholoma sublateritium FD-334 SS-4]
MHCRRSVLAAPLSVADTTILIEAIIPLEAYSSGFLYTLLSGKDGLTKIPVIGAFSAQVVLVELQIIDTPFLKLGEALVAAAHVSLTDKADAIKANITASLAAAIKAYSIY